MKTEVTGIVEAGKIFDGIGTTIAEDSLLASGRIKATPSLLLEVKEDGTKALHIRTNGVDLTVLRGMLRGAYDQVDAALGRG